MPHVIVKHFPGWSEEQRVKVAESIVNSIADIVGCSSGVISVAVESIEKEEWKEHVYDPEIVGKSDSLYIKPQYSM